MEETDDEYVEYEADLNVGDDDDADNDDNTDESASFPDLTRTGASSLDGFLGANTPLERRNSSLHPNLK